VVFVVLALLSAGAVACGSGTSRLSAEEFAEQANIACDETNDAIMAINLVDATDPDASAGGLERIAEIQQELRDRLAGLRPPSDAQAVHDEWIEQIDIALDESTRLADAVRSGDVATQTDANQVGGAAAERAEASATQLGASECVVESEAVPSGG